MRLKDRGDAYADKFVSLSDDEAFCAYNISRNLFNEAIAEGRRKGIEDAIALFEKSQGGVYTRALVVSLLKKLAEDDGTKQCGKCSPCTKEGVA